MTKEFPSGMNEKCFSCPTAQLCVDIIETSIDTEASEGFGTQLEMRDTLPDALSSNHFRAMEARQESAGDYADAMQKIAKSARENLVVSTGLCDGPTKRLFGKTACSQDIQEQAMMLPFMSGVNPRFPEAMKIQAASDKLLDEND